MKLKDIAKVLETSEIQPFVNLIRKERPYRTPKGYIKWEVLSTILALCIESREDSRLDKASRLNSYKCALWLVQDAPVYALSPGIIQAFQDSDVLEEKALFAEIEPPLRTFMLLFPQGLIKTPDGSHLDWMVVHFADRELLSVSAGSAFGIEVPAFSHDHERNLHWSGVCNEETVWFSGSGLLRTGELVHSDQQLGRSNVTTADQKFLAGMRSLCLQSLLALSYAPDLVEQEEVARQKASSRSYNREVQSRSVRWLGRNYQYKRRPSIGNRKSPRGHWRKAHSRRVAMGKGREQREWRWFPANWIGE